ncbi:MAG: hypothetical protein BZ134_06530 [Methanosphaera sp. SHI1033]|nr:MAG: hypothetical protein BZ134_06530 [Methanosphaera sp. SHI1033]
MTKPYLSSIFFGDIVYELIVSVFSIFIGFFISIIWSYYVLRPYYVYLSSKMDEPFYDGVSMVTSAETFRGKYFLFNDLLIFAPFVFVASVVPDLLFHNIFYYMSSVIFCSIILVGFIIDLREDIFVHPRFVKHGEISILEHFSPDGYCYTAYYMLCMIIIVMLVIFGVFYYLFIPNTDSIIMIIIGFISLVFTVFPDLIDKVTPFDMKTSTGFIIYAIFIIILLFIISLNVLVM